MLSVECYLRLFAQADEQLGRTLTCYNIQQTSLIEANLRKRNAMALIAKKVFLTGSTSGLGNCVARLLKQQGYYVIALCRTPEQADSLKQNHLCDAAVLADLSDADAIKSLPGQLNELGVNELTGFIHCAAVTTTCPVETTKIEEMKYVFEVNIFGFMALLQQMIPLLRAGRGRMVLTSSVAGFTVMPMVGTYAASKHAFEAFASATRRELSSWGIKVSIVRPGGIKTRMLHRHIEDITGRANNLSGTDKQLYSTLYEAYAKAIRKGYETAASPEKIARTIVKAFEARRPKTAYYPGLEPKILRFVDLFIPDRIADYMVRKIF